MFEFLMGVMLGCGLIALGYALIVGLGLLAIVPGFVIFTILEWIVRGDAHAPTNDQ